MKKLLAAAAGLGLAAFVSAPAQAVNAAPQATASAKIYRPLTIAATQNLDFGTIILSGAGSWTGEVVSIDQTGARTCGGSTGNLTCSGTPQAASYHLVGTNNAIVTISAPAFSMSGSNGGTLQVTPSAPATKDLGAAGSSTGVDVPIGGSITLNSTTTDGLYTGTFNVSANYQ